MMTALNRVLDRIIFGDTRDSSGGGGKRPGRCGMLSIPLKIRLKVAEVAGRIR